MVSLEQAVAAAAALPEVTEGTRWGNRTWFVAEKAFAWERPFSKADVKRFGAAGPPVGPIVAVRVIDLAERDALLAGGDGPSHGGPLFSIAHFDNYAAVLVQLDAVDAPSLEALLLDAWLAVAPAALVSAHVDLDGADGPRLR